MVPQRCFRFDWQLLWNNFLPYCAAAELLQDQFLTPSPAKWQFTLV
jgi:hypothetical protein